MTLLPVIDISPGSPGVFGLALIGYLGFVNALTWISFRTDKRRAMTCGSRVPEANLLLLSACGGWPGAKLAQRQFRHKMRKQPFCGLLDVIVLAWLGCGIAALPQTQALIQRVAESAGERAQGEGTSAVGYLSALRHVMAENVGPVLRASVPDKDAVRILSVTKPKGGETQAGRKPLPHRFGPGSE